MARHIRKLDDHEAIHAKLAFPPRAKCAGCGGRPFVRAITMCPLDEAKKRMPELEQLMVMDPQSIMQQLVQINESHLMQKPNPKPYLKIGVAYACKSCAPSMEKQLAKAPSWMIVEINRGPAQRKLYST